LSKAEAVFVIARLISVSPPATGIYHLTRRSRQPFTPPEWKFAGYERFDDPNLNAHDMADVNVKDSYRVIYTASDKRAAIRESIAHFRPSLNFLSALEHDVIDKQTTAQESLSKNYSLSDGRIRGLVPQSWIVNRHIGRVHLHEHHRFVDITDTHNLSYLRTIPELVSIAINNGIQDIDLSAITGNCRPLTQACARHIHGLTSEQGDPSFAGIRYISRHGSQQSWECWALFDDRMEHEDLAVEVALLDRNDADLLDALEALDLLLSDVTGSSHG
jgi:hypothetical protein